MVSLVAEMSPFVYSNIQVLVNAQGPLSQRTSITCSSRRDSFGDPFLILHV